MRRDLVQSQVHTIHAPLFGLSTLTRLGRPPYLVMRALLFAEALRLFLETFGHLLRWAATLISFWCLLAIGAKQA